MFIKALLAYLVIALIVKAIKTLRHKSETQVAEEYKEKFKAAGDYIDPICIARRIYLSALYLPALILILLFKLVTAEGVALKKLKYVFDDFAELMKKEPSHACVEEVNETSEESATA